MTESDFVPGKVHLVGSVGLPTVKDVLSICGRSLGRRLERIPDGEPGGRRMWISWQVPVLRANPYFKLVDPEKGHLGQMMLADGVNRSDVVFDELGYAIEARSSYQDFVDARARGDVAAGVRFQVSLPTPYAVVRNHFSADSLPIAWEAYTEAMIREVALLCEHIPPSDLSIQWDVCQEMLIWDGGGTFRWNLPGEGRAQILAHLTMLAAAVPDEVQLGFHLCYGDIDAKHFFDPKDTGAIVELTNALVKSISRPIEYFHFPVPVRRSDSAFFEPLRGLRVSPSTLIFVGLIHGSESLEQTRARIDMVHRYLPNFGIATECGMARSRRRDLVEKLIQRQADATVEPAA